MQVAQRTMKSQPIIVGVDQDPIKSIENCISLQEDLMSDRCLKSIQKSLKSWKTDVVLCDGAPHYGVNIKEESVNQSNCFLSVHTYAVSSFDNSRLYSISLIELLMMKQF